jgi:hypothetical protein
MYRILASALLRLRQSLLDYSSLLASSQHYNSDSRTVSCFIITWYIILSCPFDSQCHIDLHKMAYKEQVLYSFAERHISFVSFKVVRNCINTSPFYAVNWWGHFNMSESNIKYDLIWLICTVNLATLMINLIALLYSEFTQHLVAANYQIQLSIVHGSEIIVCLAKICERSKLWHTHCRQQLIHFMKSCKHFVLGDLSSKNLYL